MEVPVPVPRAVPREVVMDRHIPVPHPVPTMPAPMPMPTMPMPMPTMPMAAPTYSMPMTTAMPTYGASYGAPMTTYGGYGATTDGASYPATPTAAAPAVGTPIA